MTKKTLLLCCLVVAAAPCVSSLYQKPRVQRTEQADLSSPLHSELLSKAVPLAEYEQRLHQAGYRIVETKRDLESQDDEEQGNNAYGEEEETDWEEDQEEEDHNDDYYISSQYLYSFSGYALKYAKCQTVQRFSEEAIQNGEYSSMVTDDLVVLRLCPQQQCSSSKQYGCHYNFAEYAIDLSDYLRIMLKHTLDKRRKLCSFCEKCGYDYNGRRMEDGKDDDDYYAYTGDEESDTDSTAANSQANMGNRYCSTYKSDCYNLGNWCDGEKNDDDGSALDVVDYLDYLDCVKVQGQGNYGDGQAWVRPFCDPYSSEIKMAPFFDPYCSQYAGNDINLKEFSGIHFQSSAFEKYHSSSCMDCSGSNYPPFYNANSMMCNNIHENSAGCTSSMMYDLFDGDMTDDSTACSFIEALRFGTYNEKGEIYTTGASSNMAREVTKSQKAGMILLSVICLALGVYSCYLHHAITNMLINTLSETQLLPSSKHRTPKRRNKARRADEDDWDMSVGGQFT